MHTNHPSEKVIRAAVTTPGSTRQGLAACWLEGLRSCTLRMLCAFLALLVAVAYRFRLQCRRRIPCRGAAILICNHVSYIDWLFILAASRRPVRFVMYYRFMAHPLLRPLRDWLGIIPIAAAHEDAAIMERAFARIKAELEAGQLVGIFPEGKLTRSGGLNPFKLGIERIVAENNAPVIPLALKGMWGSLFSHSRRVSSRSVRARVSLIAGRAIPAEQVSAHGLAISVAYLGQWRVPLPYCRASGEGITSADSPPQDSAGEQQFETQAEPGPHRPHAEAVA